jgi:hypothetical protein
METCLGVLLAESLNAKVTAVYVTGNSTGQELRKICGADEWKRPGPVSVVYQFPLVFPLLISFNIFN